MTGTFNDIPPEFNTFNDLLAAKLIPLNLNNLLFPLLGKTLKVGMADDSFSGCTILEGLTLIGIDLHSVVIWGDMVDS